MVPNDDCAPRHRLIIARLVLHTEQAPRKSTIESRIKTWRLRNVELQRKFQNLVSDRAACRQDDDAIDTLWDNFKEALLASARSVCGCTKGPSRHKEAWWWNDEVVFAIAVKKGVF